MNPTCIYVFRSSFDFVHILLNLGTNYRVLFTITFLSLPQVLHEDTSTTFFHQWDGHDSTLATCL